MHREPAAKACHVCILTRSERCGHIQKGSPVIIRDKGWRGSFYKAPSRAPPEPPARARILSHTTSVAERHPCAASLANSPLPSSRVEAVGQHRGRRAAHPHCQPPGDVVAALRLAPSPLPLRVRRPAPFEHFAVGAMPRLSAVEPDSAVPTAVMLPDAASILCLTSVGRASTGEHWHCCDHRLTVNAREPPPAAGRRRAGVGARREGRL